MIAAGFFSGCYENVIDDTADPYENKLTVVEGKLNLPAGNKDMYNECTVLSLGGTSEIKDGNFDTEAYINNKVQTFILQDDECVYMMNRTPVSTEQSIEFSIESTAIAMVTMYPLFSTVERSDYEYISSLIKNSPNYPAFYDEVADVISNHKNIYDESNDKLLIAFSDLMEELCGETESEGNYDADMDEITTKAIFQHAQINPTYIDARINGNAISLRTVNVTPSYYGTISLPDGRVINKVIASSSDFGIMDLLKEKRGIPMEYTFTKDGNYRFSFSRINEEATLDFYMRIAGSIFSTVGLSIDKNSEGIVESAKYISNAIADAGSGVSDGKMDVMDWLKIAYDAALNQISTIGKLYSFTFSESIMQYCKILSSSLLWYDKIKGASNLGLRLAYAFDAPETINFCLCYYDNQITTCTKAALYKLDGDEQIGYSNQRLLLPISVYVRTTDDDGVPYESSSYHRVKFDVVSGGGEVESNLVSADNNNQASTYWTLGDSGEQIVKATVVDIITDKEISEPVYFTASLNKADITIRLDWSKHSGNTDIDLHVIDPFNEEIYFGHMTSASGGYLDRDDTVGPGPEHIRWSDAPVGTYKIYVHYYPNGAEDRSVTTYKVTATVCGVNYQPKIGSIAYDQVVPIGQFTVGTPEVKGRVNAGLVETDPYGKSIVDKK